MKQTFRAKIWQEGSWYIIECLETGVTTQGKTRKSALKNLKEALHLYFSEPFPGKTKPIEIFEVEVDVDAA